MGGGETGRVLDITWANWLAIYGRSAIGSLHLCRTDRLKRAQEFGKLPQTVKIGVRNAVRVEMHKQLGRASVCDEEQPQIPLCVRDDKSPSDVGMCRDAEIVNWRFRMCGDRWLKRWKET